MIMVLCIYRNMIHAACLLFELYMKLMNDLSTLKTYMSSDTYSFIEGR